ncbi:Hsp20/alpha crystallin family protein [Lacisediminihabitans sp.]|uniref:Hsp20/alpha crystallin family protein n=1 Tax=Lacisediminihabitans sp. TaxID=2787631 RepID=UPI00374CDB2E
MTAILYPNRPLYTARTATRSIPLDLYRDGDNYIVTADLPGIDPTTVDIDVDGQLLSIRAERTAPAGDNVTWLSRERQAGSFLRQLTLGRNIDTEKIAARYDNGVLNLTLPVSEKARARKIEISNGSVAPTEAAEVPAA